MNRREFIQAAGAFLLASALPFKIKRIPIVYYVDLAVIDINLRKAIFWGNPQEMAEIVIPHDMTLLFSENKMTERIRDAVQVATRLHNFSLMPHPWQAKMEEDMNLPWGVDDSGQHPFGMHEND